MARRGGALISYIMVVAVTARAAWAQVAPPTKPGEVTPFERAKAESLLRDGLPCLGCHALGTEGGKIAPELATVRDRRGPDYIARMIADPQATVPGTIMPHTPMPRAWRALVTRYLGGDAGVVQVGREQSDAGGPALRPVSAPPGDSVGAALYARFCTGCHGAQGRGDGPNANALPVPPAKHASRDAMSARPDDSLYDTIAGGGAIMNRSPRMPAYGTTLTPAQIRALVKHIRVLCQCGGPTWSTDGTGTPRD